MRKILSAALVGAFLDLPAGAATIVQNGSFESLPGRLSHGSWGVFTTIPGWRTLSGAGIEIQTNPTLGTIDAQDGKNYVELDSHNNSAMVQSLALTAGRYLLGFYYSPRTNAANDNGISYLVKGNAGPVSLRTLVSGSISGPSAVPLTKVGLWTEVSVLFDVRRAGSYDLQFAATGRSTSYGGLIDNVSLTPSPVPVPAAGLLLVAALGGLAALCRPTI